MEEAGLSSTKPLHHDFICEQPHTSVQFFKALSESTCVLFRRALLLRSDKRWTKLPNAAHNGDLEVHFEKRVITVHGACGGGGHWLPSHHHLPIIVPTNTTIADPIFPPLFHKSFPADSKTMHCNVLLVKYHLVNKLKGFHLAGNFTTGKFFPLQNLDHNAFFFGLSWTALICYCLSLSAQKRGVWMHKILFRPTLVSPLSSRCWRTCGPVSLKIFVTKFNVKGALSMWGMLKFLDQDNFVLIWRQD